MLGRIFSKSHQFFDDFDSHAALISEAAQKLHQGLLAPFSHFEWLPIKMLERQANEVMRKCVEKLHKTFITPLDRDQIYQLIRRMDDIINCIDKVANRITLYQIHEATKELLNLSSIVLKTVLEVEKSVNVLRNLKHSALIEQSCTEIQRLEHEANAALREAIAHLFAEEQDAREIIKWKELYEGLENATNCCADTGDVMIGILLESD